MQPEFEVWIDAQLPPSISIFIHEQFKIKCTPLRNIGLRDADDLEIFKKAKHHHCLVVLITKDADFIDLLLRLNSPPKIIFLSCGNTSNVALREILSSKFNEAMKLLDNSENEIVEIST